MKPENIKGKVMETDQTQKELAEIITKAEVDLSHERRSFDIKSIVTLASYVLVNADGLRRYLSNDSIGYLEALVAQLILLVGNGTILNSVRNIERLKGVQELAKKVQKFT